MYDVKSIPGRRLIRHHHRLEPRTTYLNRPGVMWVHLTSSRNTANICEKNGAAKQARTAAWRSNAVRHLWQQGSWLCRLIGCEHEGEWLFRDLKGPIGWLIVQSCIRSHLAKVDSALDNLGTAPGKGGLSSTLRSCKDRIESLCLEKRPWVS